MAKMMPGTKLVASMGLALVATAFAAGCARPQGSPDARIGLQVAEQRCSRCHAIGLTGPSPAADAPPLRDLYKRYPINDLRRAFAEGIEVAHPRMPVFQLSRREVDHLLAYLRSIDPCAQPSTDREAMARCFAPL